jgi:hypothetical protein
MPAIRPILDTFQRTKWIADTPVGDPSRARPDSGPPPPTVGETLPQQIQIAVQGDGPISTRRLVPLTAPARELLHGTHRESADRVLRGMLAPLDAQLGASNFRGFSLATGDAGFATNMLMSNIESGYEPDSVAAGDRVGLHDSLGTMLSVTRGGKAQNTGWADFGPRVSAKVRALVEQGAGAGRDTAAEVALTALHELGHSHTPPGPNVPNRVVWLEEGIAETLSWWPGAAAKSMERMGVPARPGYEPDPYTAAADSVASREYRDRHRSVLKLLDLAGVQQYDDNGAPNTAGLATATQLLQGDRVDRVPRNIARAIVRHNRLDPAKVPLIADLVAETAGKPAQVDLLAEMVLERQ